MSRTRNYLVGLSSGYVYTVATVLVGLWLTPFTLRFLDREEFAVFTLAGDVLTWLALLDFGISSALRIQAAQLTGHPEQAVLNRLASTAFFAELGVVLAVLACGMVLALLFPQFFPVRPDLQRDATILVLLLLIGTAFSLGTQTFSALLVAHQQIHVDNALNLLNLATRTVLTVVLLKAGWGVYSLGVANLAARLTTAMFAVVRTFRLLPALQLRWHHVSWHVLKGTGGIGIWFTVGGLAGIMIMSLDRVMTGKLVSVEMVTTLSLTGRLYALGASLLNPITNTARPMLAQLMGQHKWAQAARVYHQLFTLSTGLAVIGAASIWSGNGTFVARWVGPQNYGGWLLDLALALKLVANSWVLPNRAALASGLFKLPQHALSRLFEGLLTAGLAVLLGMRFGVTGVVFAGVSGAVLVSCWYLPRLTAQMFQQQFSRFVSEDVVSVLAVVGLMIPVAWLVRQATAALGASMFVAGCQMLATAGIGLGILWMRLDRELRDQLLAKALKSMGQLRTRLQPAKT